MRTRQPASSIRVDLDPAEAEPLFIRVMDNVELFLR